MDGWMQELMSVFKMEVCVDWYSVFIEGIDG